MAHTERLLPKPQAVSRNAHAASSRQASSTKRARRSGWLGSRWAKLGLGALAIAAMAAIWRYTPVSDFLTAEHVRAAARAMRQTSWAPVALVLAYVPATFVMFPRPLLTLIAVLAFGPWLGFTYSMTGILAAALAAYGIGRHLPRGLVERLAGRHLAPLTEAVRRHGVVAVFAMRVVPVAPAAVADVASGALRVKVAHYLLGTFLGMAPGVVATTMFGDQIAAALDDEAEVNYWVVAAAVLVIAAMAFWSRRWLKRHAGLSKASRRRRGR